LKLKCSDGGDDCQKVDALKNLAAAYQNSFPVYDFRGQKAPNSNSFADYVTRSVGLTYSFPKLAKGWDFHQKNP
jgi:hypothetical protein